MPLAGFEPTIPVFKWAKTFHALDRAATVTVSRFYQRRLNARMHEYVYFCHDECTFQCTDMCTSDVKGTLSRTHTL
jgi:hypothetical protein